MTVCRRVGRAAVPLSLLAIIAGCAGPGPRVPRTDGPPARPIDAASIAEPVPRLEPRSRYGNHSPYTVNGRTYHVLASASGYRERGLASWYGNKFHGRRTSSGERFDMYQISGAHRTLPLPAYAEVTNLDNGRRLVVRINDRGPFHDGRIIDLSYAAAVKLGFANKGTARVEVRAIDVLTAGSQHTAIPATWLQVGAFAERRRAEAVKTTLERAGLKSVTIEPIDAGRRRLHRVRLGPYADDSRLRDDAAQVAALGLDWPVRVTECAAGAC